MTEEEGRRVAGPIVRIASRRFQLRSVSGDALDAGAEANFLTNYVTRVLGGSGPEPGPGARRRQDVLEAEEQRQRDAWEQAEVFRRADQARANAIAAAREAASRANAAGAPRGDEPEPDPPGPGSAGGLDVFTGMEEAGLG